MTDIIFYRKKDAIDDPVITGFVFDGHAGYAEEGSDIVCAALSVLVINTLNSIDSFTEDLMDVAEDQESGSIHVDFPEGYGHDTELLLKSLILGVRQIYENEDYSSYVSLKFEEV